MDHPGENLFSICSAMNGIKIIRIDMSRQPIKLTEVKNLVVDSPAEKDQFESILQQQPLATLPNGAIVSSRKSCLAMWNVNNNEPKKGNSCCGPECTIF